MPRAMTHDPCLWCYFLRTEYCVAIMVRSRGVGGRVQGCVRAIEPVASIIGATLVTGSGKTPQESFHIHGGLKDCREMPHGHKPNPNPQYYVRTGRGRRKRMLRATCIIVAPVAQANITAMGQRHACTT